MKTYIFILCFYLFSSAIYAQTERTIHLETAGTLSALLGADLQTITDLTLTGNISHADFTTITSMSKLKNLDLGGVDVIEQSIPARAFQNKVYNSFVLPRNITTIKSSAFELSQIGNTLVFPSSLEIIEGYTFNQGQFGGLDFSKALKLKSIQRYCFHKTQVTDGVLDLSVQIELSQLPESFIGCQLKVILPAAMKVLPENAFKLFEGEAILPEGLETLGNYSFFGAKLSKGLILPSGLKTIHYWVFQNSNLPFLDFSQAVNLKDVFGFSFQNAIVQDGIIDLSPCSLLSESNEAFTNNKMKVILPRAMKHLPMGMLRSFEGEFVLPDALESIGAVAFYTAKLKDGFVFPSSLKSIGNGTFEGATVPFLDFSEASSLVSMGSTAFKNCKTADNLIDLSNCSSLSSLNSSFANSQLKVILPTAMKVLPENTFRSFEGEAILPEGLETLGNYSFFGAKLSKGLILPSSLKTIHYWVFQNSNLPFLDFSQAVNLKDVFGFSFQNAIVQDGIIDLSPCSLLSESNEAFTNNKMKVILPRAMKHLPMGMLRSFEGEFVLPDALESIGAVAFYTAKLKDGFVFPSSLKSIGNGTFEGATVPFLDFSEASSLVSMGSTAFKNCKTADNLIDLSNCSSLSSLNSSFANSQLKVILPTAMKVLPENTFRSFEGEAILPEGLETLGNYSFFGAKLSKGLILPSSLKTIHYWVFQNSNLPFLDFSQAVNLKDLFGFSFQNAIVQDGVIDLSPCSLLSESNEVFTNNKMKVILPRAMKHLPMGMLRSFEGEFVLPDALESIGSVVFYATKLNVGLVLPASLKSISNNAFANMTAPFLDFSQASNLTSMGSDVFKDSKTDNNLIDLSNCSLLNVMNSPFASSQFKVLLPPDMKILPSLAFKSFRGEVRLPEGLEVIGNNAFENYIVPAGDSISIPKTITSIGNNAFQNAKFQHIISYSVIPSLLGGNVFGGVDQPNITLHVPNGSETLYSQTAQWKNFKLATFDFEQEEPKGGSDGSVLISIRANNWPSDYAITPWNYDTNTTSSNGRIESTYPTLAVGEYEWTTRNLKLKYDAGQDRSWANYSLDFVTSKLEDNFKDDVTDAQKISAFEALYGTWILAIEGALSYRDPDNCLFFRKDDNFGLVNVDFGLPDKTSILQLIGQTPSSGSITSYQDFVNYVVGYPTGTIDYIKNKDNLPDGYEKNSPNTSGLSFTLLGERDGNQTGAHSHWGNGFRLFMKEGVTSKFGGDFNYFWHFNSDNPKFGSVRYTRALTDKELGYRMYVDNCNDAVVIYPLDKETKLTELPRGLERGLALKYADLPGMIVYRNWSDICAESDQIRKSINGAPVRKELPESPCDTEPEPEPEYEQIIADPSENQNYILTRIYTKDDESRWMDQIQYFDGLGRPNQVVQVGASPQSKDLVVLQEYDSFGREAESWLPAAIKDNRGEFVPFSRAKESAIASNLNDQHAFSKPVYETSPLNRVLEQYGPGADWQKNNRSVKTGYLTNQSKAGTTLAIGDSLVCAMIVCTDETTYKYTKNYDAGELYITRLKDEDNNTLYEFKDKLGQVLLTRQISAGELYDTYYVYDDLGNQSAVFPPIASDLIYKDANELKAKSDVREKYAYLYQYDNRNRPIRKKLPGIDSIYYVYDKADRLIFSQDGEQRNGKEWTFNKYDILGRLIISGIYRNDSSQEDLESKYSNLLFTEKIGSGAYNYTWTNLTEADIMNIKEDVLLVNYYDSYDNIPNIFNYKTDLKYITKEGYSEKYSSAKGMLVATRIKNIDSAGKTAYSREGEMASVMYYDYRGRIIQTHSTNHLGGIESEYISYNFVGQPTERLHEHSVVASATKTEEGYSYIYDHAGRLIDTKHKLNNGDSVLIVHNKYDELGRLKTNTKGNSANLATTYNYNIRSWTNNISSPLLKINLAYTYGGNIKSQLWNQNINKQGYRNRKYTFEYDGLSRLEKAIYSSNAARESYGTSYEYDKHGNIMTLKRNGKTTKNYDLVDDLTMTYVGNQLTKVRDEVKGVSLLSESADFQNFAGENGLMTYNRNGALASDSHKGITSIQYNSLNLPTSITVGGVGVPVSGNIKYTYSASGIKLQTIHTENNDLQRVPMMGISAFGTADATVTKTDYVGNKVYENDKLKRILIDGGYYDAIKKKYFYYLTDHLGNNRVVAEANGRIVQQTQYYPFGMAFADHEGEEEQPYKYNNKELDKRLRLNTYDYSARHLNPAIGRLDSFDPLAEKHYNISPYAYVLNNPLRFIDPTGMTEEERLAAIAKIREFLGTAYRKMDCSEAVDKAVRESTTLGTFKKGSGIDTESGSGKWANGVALIVSNSRDVENNDIKAGNTATFKSGRSDHQGEDGKFDHIGMITNVTKDKDGNVTSFDVVHSTSKGVKEQKYDMNNGMPGFELKGFQAWDTPSSSTSFSGQIGKVTQAIQKDVNTAGKFFKAIGNAFAPLVVRKK